jgi:4-aminobutyrate aminotransferase-like enzyme
MGAQMAGGIEAMKEWIGYRDPNMVQMPFPYPWVLEQRRVTGKDMFHSHLRQLGEQGHDVHRIAAFIVESFQGWGAVFYPVDYIQEMRRFSLETGALLIFDEIQAGFGRTGKLFAYEHYEVEPDLVICGKAISSGPPLSAVLGRAPLIDLDPAYTSTHGGHPLACAAGLANIEVFEREHLIEEAKHKEAIFRGELARWEARFPGRIGRILGRGMIFGVFFTKPGSDELDLEFTDRVVEKALHKGVFSIRTGRGTLKLGPPLNIPDDALLEGLQVYEEAIGEADNEVSRMG